jgi:DNA-binding SARP family transcriptional activator
LRLWLLGDIRIERDGEPCELPASKRARALLGYLVATAVPQTRRHLCDLLWDGPDDPRAALRWSLSKLRPLVDDGQARRLNADHYRVAFVTHDAFVDVEQIRTLSGSTMDAARLEVLEEYSVLCRGEFLDGLDLPNCYRFHQWCMAERERFGGIRRAILTALVARLAGEPDRALPHAQAMVAADPLSETSHAKLVSLLAAIGRPREAVEHSEHAKRMLARELAAPLTGELARAISEIHRVHHGLALLHESPEAKAEPLPPSADVKVRPPLIGRVGERGRIAAALRMLRKKRPDRMLFFIGEPGIGKTRLLEEVAEQARHSRGLVLAARAFEAEMIRPYGCWIDALAALPAPVVPSAIGRDLTVLLPTFGFAAAADGDRVRLFAAVVALLTDLSARQPLVLTFDDLQWIDDASASLLHYVLRSMGRTSRFLFAGSARLGELDDNISAKRLTESLLRDGVMAELRLAPLSAVDVKSLLSDWAPEVDADAAFRESGGNPLFTLELVRARRRGVAASGRSLDEIVERELARLESPVRTLVLFASALGREFRPEILAKAIATEEMELFGRFDLLERRGLLSPTRNGGYDFAHDLVRQAIYRSLSQPRRRLIHRQIARALEGAVCYDESLNGDLAHHAALAEDHLLAARAALAAGERCLHIFANTEAAILAERGLSAVQRVSAGHERTRLNLSLLLVKMTAAASPGMRSIREFPLELQRAIEAAEADGFHSEATRGLLMLAWLTFKGNDTERTHQTTLQAAETSLAADDATRCQQLANTARCLMEVEVDVPRALSLAGKAGAIAEALRIDFAELQWARGLIARWRGEIDPAHRLIESALSLAVAKDDHWREYQCLIWLATTAYESGRLKSVSGYCNELDRVAGLMGDPRAPGADALRALAAIGLDDDSGESALARALAGLREIDDKAALAYSLNQFALIRLDRCEFEPAARLAAEALAAARALGRSTEIVVASALLARAAVGHGDRRAGAVHLGVFTAASGPLSARARLHLSRAAELTGLTIPMLIATG